MEINVIKVVQEKKCVLKYWFTYAIFHMELYTGNFVSSIYKTSLLNLI